MAPHSAEAVLSSKSHWKFIAATRGYARHQGFNHISVMEVGHLIGQIVAFEAKRTLQVDLEKDEDDVLD